MITAQAKPKATFWTRIACALGFHRRLVVERRGDNHYHFKSSECFYCPSPGEKFEVDL